MTEPKFTKGPWKANFDEYTKPYVEIINEDNVVIAQIPDGEVIKGDKIILGLENIEANINLIAAAPEMYEVLEFQCKNCLGRYSISKDSNECALYIRRECMIANALRKARGEEE